MSSITPVPPPGPSGPSSPPVTLSTPTPSIADNQSTYLSDISAGKEMTIMGFSSSIISATNKAAETAWSVQQYNANSRQDFYNASIENSLDMLAIYSAFLRIAGRYSNEYKKTDQNVLNTNALINSYNGSISNAQNQISLLNQAIQDFNAGNITQAQYNTAVSNYNTFKSGFNNLVGNTNASFVLFNDGVAVTNGNITALNQELAAAGVPPLNSQDGYTGSNALALPNVPGGVPPGIPTLIYGPVTLGTVSNTMDSRGKNDGAELVSDLFQPYFDLMGGQFAITAQTLQNQSTFQGFIQFIFGNIPFAPPAFYTQSPKISIGGGPTTGGAGSGVSLGTLITSLSNVLMEGIIAKGIFSTNTARFSLPNSPQVVNQLQYLGLALLARMGLQAGSSALRLLEGRLANIDPRSSPVLVAVGATLASEIAQGISSGLVLKSIKEILAKAYPNLSGEALNSLAQQLASATELFMLQAGLLQLTTSLGSPELQGQVLGSLSSVQNLTPVQPTTADIVNNEVLMGNIIKSAVDNTNISRDNINQAIKKAYVNGNLNQNDFVQSLVENGAVEKDANNAFEIVRSSINSEIQGAGILDKSAADNRLKQSTLGSELVNKIIQGKADLTNRELRDQLTSEFIANGASHAEAIRAATTAVIGPASTGPADLSATLREKALAAANGLGFNPAQSAAFADQLTATVLGPNSLSSLIDARVSELTKLGDAKVTEKVQESLNTFLKPTLELYAFADRLRDPANAYVFLGPMYAHPQPLQFTQGVNPV